MSETTRDTERLDAIRELEGAVREHHDYRRLPEHVPAPCEQDEWEHWNGRAA